MSGLRSPRRKAPYTRESIARALGHHELTGAVYLVSPPMTDGPQTSSNDRKWRVKLSALEEPLVLTNREAYVLAVGLSAAERRWKQSDERLLDLLKAIVPYLETVTDEGPIGEGWCSPRLQALKDEVVALVEHRLTVAGIVTHVRLCDQPGCREQATRVTIVDAANTGPKEWFSCNAHRPITRLVPVPLYDDERSPRGRFGPLIEGAQIVGQSCVLCGEPMRAGDVPSLISQGPADDDEAERQHQGRAYNAVAGVAHESCAWTS